MDDGERLPRRQRVSESKGLPPDTAIRLPPADPLQNRRASVGPFKPAEFGKGRKGESNSRPGVDSDS
jgi:hypothetical protein